MDSASLGYMIGYCLGYVIVFGYLALFIINWFFRSFALFKMARNRGLKSAWAAWVPLANKWVLADLIGGKYAEIWKMGGVNWILTFGWLLSFVPYVGMLLAVAYWVYTYFCYYELYQIYDGERSGLYILLNVIVGFVNGFVLFFIRNNGTEFDAD